MHYTRWLVPQQMLDSSIPHNDLYIGCTELLAVVMCFYTFRSMLVDSYWTCYIDNDGVLAALLKGSISMRALDLNQIVGKLWLEIARAGTCFHGARVESKANLADIPTREESMKLMSDLGAVWHNPVLPDWMSQFWLQPGSTDSCAARP